MSTDLRIVKTCGACPVQYDIHLPDGRYVYFRYRHGYLSLELYRREEDFGGRRALAEFGEQMGEAFDGFMDDDEAMGIIARRVPQLVLQAAS